MKKSTHKKGFTLIELLFVISIIGVLSGVILQSLKSAQSKARDDKRAGEIRNIKIALHDYFNDPSGGNGVYPASASLTIALVPKYISMLPVDPLYPTYDYQYVRGTIPDSYGIRAYNEKSNVYCKTGVNVNPTWWASAPMCSF